FTAPARSLAISSGFLLSCRERALYAQGDCRVPGSPGLRKGSAMLRILGPGTKLCDGITRRELMRVGALSLFGSVTLPRLLRAAETKSRPSQGHARSVIMFNLLGGPSHQDMFDLKPSAPVEIRGEFKPI